MTLLVFATSRTRTLAFAGAILLASCGPSRFATRSVMWIDDDQRPFAPRPAESFIPRYSAVDNLVFRRLAGAWRLDMPRPAINVNALDEVPRSSWFENRIGLVPMSVADVARGACDELAFPPPAPWRIVQVKREGAYPGFVIEDASGVRHLLKSDGERQPEHVSAADAIGAAVFHAAGYHVPCNRVVSFPIENLIAGSGDSIEREDMQRVLATATRTSGGHYRALLSRYVDGEPIGPWTFEGIRADDLNDVVPHEHRRELRGMFLLAAWIGHWDLRDPNTLSSFIPVGPAGAGYVRHYVIDFGDSFGSLTSDALLARRLEHQHWLEPGDALADFLTLGLVDRPWHHAEIGFGGRVLGHYEETRFDPERWRPTYPTPAFEQRTEHDQAWMARIIARFTPAHIRALARRGRLSSRIAERELAQTMLGRRRAILERYLTRLSPLSWPRVRPTSNGGTALCMQDLAVLSGLRDGEARRYRALARTGTQRWEDAPRAAADGWVCTPLPVVAGATQTRPQHLTVELDAQTPGRDRPGAVHLHFVVSGARDHRLVGLRRVGERRA